MKKDDIDLEHLKNFIVYVLDELIKTNRSKTIEIDIHKDNYWDLAGTAMLEVETKPEALDVGSLSDDVDFLNLAMNQQRSGASLDAYSLVHAAPLLRYIAERHVKNL